MASGQSTAKPFEYAKYLREKCDAYNATHGTLEGIDCPKCRNKGQIAVIIDGEEYMQECSCIQGRRSLQLIERSGLKGSLEKYTFAAFDVREPWQRIIRDKAAAYVEDYKGKWLYIGGQVGAGKTHLCTAVVGELLRRGVPARYMLWRDEIVRIKATVTDETAYRDAVEPLKHVEALYIDDFFKTESGKQPTSADINVAFELLNHRYINNKPTIISSERSVDDLLAIDEATGSRIYQMTRDHCINIARGAGRNYRLRKENT